MRKKNLPILLALFISLFFILPLSAEDNSDHLIYTIKELRFNMRRDYHQMANTKNKLSENYKSQHQKMVNIMKECNEVSLLLYSQKQEFTFDISYTLEKVKKEFFEFENDSRPYKSIVEGIDIEIERYARLIEVLRRLPPELDDIKGVEDSLLYRNDTLDTIHDLSISQLELTIQAATLSDSLHMPFLLDAQSEQDRDSCIFYATELMKMYIESKAIVVADSIHYNETYLRLKESYEYANKYYKLLQRRIFIDGQIPWPVILANFDHYWDEAKEDFQEKYALNEWLSEIGVGKQPLTNPLKSPTEITSIDSALMELPIDDTLAATADVPTASEKLAIAKRFEFSVQLFVVVFLVLIFILFWLATRILLWPIFKWVKPVKRVVAKEQRRYYAMLLAILAFFIFNMGTTRDNQIFAKAFSLANTFLWLLAAIVTALLIRLKPEHLKTSFKLYRPTIFLAFFVIGCRVLFIPNSLMNIIFPPVLIVFFCWLLLSCLRHAKRADQRDQVFCWISLSVTGIAMIIAISGYIFASLMILVWWYFQMAAILTMITIWHLIVNYKEKKMNPRISEYLEHITTVTGQDKKTYLFRVTWFYDLVKDVVLPTLVLMSFSLCLHLAMDVFDFDDLYENLFNNPFIQLTNKDGASTFRVSLYSILLLTTLFFIFRFANRAIHSIWQQSRYARYLRKTQRQTIHKDEVNLSLGNSLINFAVWIIYAIIVVLTLHIPTGSLTLVAGGFSAGVGLALKDIINNFIYGIQLMSGRLKVGDWIECDGIRGKVTSINYQTTQVETVNNTSVSFLNADLFAKNFTNLTKGNSYEFLKILVGVAYGTNVQQVREVIENAMQVMRTKDSLGRDVVDPTRGIYVRFGEFGDSAVNIAVKQYVLASEHIAYADKAKEVIYNALNENGITIPFPQRDIHIITEEPSSED